MGRPVTAEELQEVIDRLQGTCMNTIDGEIREITNDEADEDDLTYDQFEEIDNQIFSCVVCGWWCETSMQSQEIEDEQVCEDCEEDYL